MPKYKACSEHPGVCRSLLVAAMLVCAACTHAQEFGLKQKSDSLNLLTLRTDSTFDQWEIRHPVYRFCTGDVNGDGQPEALVGVIKRTRFFHDMGRRLFIYKNVHGRIRALWMGSKLGGILQDFRYIAPPTRGIQTDSITGNQPAANRKGWVRSLETDTQGCYYVAEYSLRKFGLSFDRFLIKAVSKEEALSIFEQ